MKEKNHDSTKKNMSMARIVIISLITAISLSLIYFVIEGILIRTTGRVPFGHELMGGDCKIYAGLFWHILTLYPMSSIDDPAPAEDPIISCNIMPLFAYILLIFIILWTILSLINKKFKPVIFAYTLALLSFLMIITIRKAMTAWKETPVALEYIRIYTTDIRPGQCVAIDYPDSELKFVKAGEDGKYGRIESSRITPAINPEDVSKSQLDKLLKAAEKVKENSKRIKNNGNYTYYVSIIYKTRDGHDSVKFYGYGGYPEGWNELTDIVNEICGGEYLRENPETEILTAEWFTENFGITDDDLPDGMTVDDYLKEHKISMKLFSGLNSSAITFCFDASKVIEEFEADKETDE